MKKKKAIFISSIVLFALYVTFAILGMLIDTPFPEIWSVLYVLGFVYPIVVNSYLFLSSKCKHRIFYFVATLILEIIHVGAFVGAILTEGYFFLLIVINAVVAFSYLSPAAYLYILPKVEKRDEKEQPEFLSRHPVAFRFGVSFFTISLISTFLYFGIAGVGFCFAMVSYNWTAVLRIVIFFIMAATTLVALVFFILSLVTRTKQKRPHPVLTNVSLPVLEFLLALTLLIPCCGNSFIFAPSRFDPSVLDDIPYASLITLKSGNNTYTGVLADQGFTHITLMFPGRADSSYSTFASIREKYENGSDTLEKGNTNFLFVDYPNFGGSMATLTEECIYEAADLFYEYTLHDLGYDWENITIAGFSMGTVVANYCASKHPCRNLFLVAPLNNLVDMTKGMLNISYLPFSWMLGFRLDAEEYAKKITCHVKIVYSESDRIVKSYLTEHLMKCYPSTPKSVKLTGYDHIPVFHSDASLFTLFNNDPLYL